jgi:phosphate transport system permease protein
MTSIARSDLGGDFEPPPFDPESPLTASGNLRRRQAISRTISGAATASAIAGVAVLVIVTFAVVRHGSAALSWHFLTRDPSATSSGGIASDIVGTILVVAVAAVMATPIGVLCALYLVEFGGPQTRSGRILRLTLDLMQGLPSVVIGLFVFGLIVQPEHAESGFAGSIALGIIMLPLIARSSQEVLLTIPVALRDAADALGVDRWRAVLTVILPSAAGGILTGSILAIARAAGETAPLLIVDGTFTPGTTIDLFGQAVPNIPVDIFTAAEAANPNGFTEAWGAALVLLALILIANIGARLLLARNRRRMGL